MDVKNAREIQTPDASEQHVEEIPPAYYDVPSAVTAESSGGIRPPNPLLYPPHVDFSKYRITQSVVSDDYVTTTTTLPAFYTSPSALQKLLEEQAALPPKPLMRLKANSNRGLEVDFDLTLNLTPLLTGLAQNDVVRDPILQIDSSSMPSLREYWNQGAQPSLQTVAQKFCADRASFKSLTLTRKVANLDTQFLEGQARVLLASLPETGRVEISFPDAYSKLVVRKGPDTSRSLFGRVIPLFYGQESTAAYNDVLTTVWPCATSSSPERRVAEEWWYMWKDAILNGVQSKKRGWVSSEDWIEAAMGVKVKSQYIDRGPSDRR